jgi:Domain of unknown function (DUF305)
MAAVRSLNAMLVHGGFVRLFTRALRCSRLSLTGVGVLLLGVSSLAGGSDADPFLVESDTAMRRMMVAMAIEPSGDADRDFVAMMVPHHQGAIDMAKAELRHGRNERVRRIAQEIIVTQLQEIAAMRLELGQPFPPAASASDPPPTPVHLPHIHEAP